jgi:uncharacterized protein (DUF58 family)
MPAFKIGRRELYILPTRIGWYYLLILLALFAIAVKFDNQPAFMMLFILVAVGMVAMVYTHNNVIGLELSSQPSRNIFAGEPAVFPVSVRNSSNKSRNAVWLICGGFHQLIHLEKDDLQSFELKLPSLQRGYLNCDPINLSSQFPIGVFFCWTKRYYSEQRCLVYPQPLDLIALPDNDSQSGNQISKANIRVGADDYAGMKSYQAGDRLRDIHWPSLAKTNKLVSIQYENQSSSSINLSWFAIPNNFSQEDKLSQLCYWVLEAEQHGLRYQLEMPNHTIEFDNGLSHYHECLSVLALWGSNEDTSND